jgi:molecular chaperone DnaJ
MPGGFSPNQRFTRFSSDEGHSLDDDCGHESDGRWPSADYYETLEVAHGKRRRGAQGAFRKLAMQWHPDKNPGDAERIRSSRKSTKPTRCLKDPQKRAAYDRFGHAAFEQGNGGMGGGPGFGAASASSFSDIFEDLFGMMGGGGAPLPAGRERGADLRYNMEITLEEAFSRQDRADPRCRPRSPARPVRAPAPRRAPAEDLLDLRRPGRVRQAQGFFTIERTCPTCQGRGQVIEDPANAAGAGRVTRSARCRSTSRPASRTAPASASPAKARPACAAGRRAISTFSCRSSRTNSSSATAPTCYCKVPISMVTAALGRRVRGADHRRRATKVKRSRRHPVRPPFRLGGKGMPVLRSRERGDMYVQVAVETPQKLTKRQKELLKEFDKESSKDTQPESAGFFACRATHSRSIGRCKVMQAGPYARSYRVCRS